MLPQCEITKLSAEQYIALALKKIEAEEETKRKIAEAEAQEETKRKIGEAEAQEETKRKKIEEEEQTKRKQIEEETKRIIAEEETKRKLAEEKTRQQELDLKRQQLNSQERSLGTKSFLDGLAEKSPNTFYSDYVKHNLQSFDVGNLLKSWSDIDDNLVKIFEEEFKKLQNSNEITEESFQTKLGKAIESLFSSNNCSTSLQYMDTSRSPRYLRGKSPDCTFIYKNFNIGGQCQCLQDFVICIGELKRSSSKLNKRKNIGQLCQYLALLLATQNRQKAYGFLLNLNELTFYFAEMIGESYQFYQSESFHVLPNLQPSNSKSNKSSVSNTPSDTSTSVVEVPTAQNTEIDKETIKKLIKFLTMEPTFYKYTMLNINPDDYLYKNEFYIGSRLGSGVSSIVYELCHNVDRKPMHAIKISNSKRFNDIYKNEIKIWRKLKELTNSNDKFNSFFINIINAPADDAQVSGRFIVFENILETLPSMQSFHAEQLIDIIEHLYKCRIIHRDIRPDNIMLDERCERVKLVDFGFAEIFEENENTKRLKIAGVISYSSLKFLEFYLNESNVHSSKYYEYERTFDLSCAINVIMYMKDVYISKKLDCTKHGLEKEKIKKIKGFWGDLIKTNKHYADLTKLIKNFSEVSDFGRIKKRVVECF